MAPPPHPMSSWQIPLVSESLWQVSPSVVSYCGKSLKWTLLCCLGLLPPGSRHRASELLQVLTQCQRTSEAEENLKFLMRWSENVNSKIKNGEKCETKSWCFPSVKAIWLTGWAAGWVLPAKKGHGQSELRVADDSHPGPGGRSSSAHHLPPSFSLLSQMGEEPCLLAGNHRVLPPPQLHTKEQESNDRCSLKAPGWGSGAELGWWPQACACQERGSWGRS